jgi:hypothetical protein
MQCVAECVLACENPTFWRMLNDVCVSWLSINPHAILQRLQQAAPGGALDIWAKPFQL